MRKHQLQRAALTKRQAKKFQTETLPTARQEPNEESWEDLKSRYVARLQNKGPEALADATLDAVTSTIKHSPKAIPALAGLIFAAVGSAPALLAAGSGLSVSILWIGYELWKRKKPPV
jgi:hypothetical protein